MAAAASTMRAHSAAVAEIGFSTRMARTFPDAAARTASSAWLSPQVQTDRVSRFSRSSIRSRSV